MAKTASDARRRVLAAALVVQVAISVVTQAFPTLVPFVKADLRLSLAHVGLCPEFRASGPSWRCCWLAGLLAAVAAAVDKYWLLLGVLVGVAAATPTPAGGSWLCALSRSAVEDP